MRVSPEKIAKVIAIDRRYRYCWGLRAVALAAGVSPGTVAKIRRTIHGEKPRRAKRPHLRRTRFLLKDVMVSSDFVRVPDGRLLLKTNDEMSRFHLGWDMAQSENAEAAVRHGENLILRMGRAPLIWKYDHGSAFTSDLFQNFLRDHGILPYPIPPRAPWAQGRIERDHREIHDWLLPLQDRVLSPEEWEKEVDEGMFMLNFIKPREMLGFKTSAEVHFHAGGVDRIDRRGFIAAVEERIIKLGFGGEKILRRAIRQVMQEWGLYEEWLDGKGAESVNTSRPYNVAI
jgi:transposase InsO family protein